MIGKNGFYNTSMSTRLTVEITPQGGENTQPSSSENRFDLRKYIFISHTAIIIKLIKRYLLPSNNKYIITMATGHELSGAFSIKHIYIKGISLREIQISFSRSRDRVS